MTVVYVQYRISGWTVDMSSSLLSEPAPGGERELDDPGEGE
jgi:hypothetical protein